MTVRDFLKLWPSMLIGGACGLALVPFSDLGVETVRASYDVRNPVILANGTLIRREGDAIEVAIVGDKRRDCIYVSLAAFATGQDGLLRDTFILRIDRPTSGATRPVGAQSFGLWRVWPVTGAVEVQIWATHQCEGRLVRTLMADIDLPKGTT